MTPCATPPLEATYRLHDFGLVVRTNSRVLPEMLDGNLRYYRSSSSMAPDAIRIDAFVEDQADWDGRFRALRDDAGCRFLGEVSDGAGVFANYRVAGGNMIVREPDILALVPGGTGATAEIRVTRGRSSHMVTGGPLRMKATGGQVEWETVVDLITGLAVNASGSLLIHGAALGTGGAGILIAGNSGCGKTTTAAALVRAGATLLTDDLCVLGERDGRVSMAGVMMPMRFVGRAPSSLERLEESLQQQGAGPKPVLPLEEAVLAQRLTWVAPKVVFLLEGQPGLAAEHVVEPIPATEACVKLLRHFVDPLTWWRRREHLDLAGRLADSCSTYRLVPGSDLRTLPATLLSRL